MLLAFGLQLPAVPPPSPPGGQGVPQATTAARPAPRDVWAPAWSHDLDLTGDLLLAASSDVIALAGPDTQLEVRRVSTGAVLWRHQSSNWQTLAAAGPLVLGVSGDHAYALDAATGRTRWVTETTGASVRLVTDGRHLLMLSETDALLRDLDTGTPLWRVGLTAPPSATAALGTTLVVIAQQDGRLVAIERATGAVRWNVALAGAARGVAAEPPMVYAGLANGSFCAFDDRNGRERWCFALRTPASGDPVVTDAVVRVALLDNSLRSFNRLNGAMGSPIALGHRPAAGPWQNDSAVFVALTTGEFVVVDRQTGRTLHRLGVPGLTTPPLLERAAVSLDGRTLVSLTLTPGAQRRLTAYRLGPSQALPILPKLPVVPGPRLTQLPAPVTPDLPATAAPSRQVPR